MAILAVKMKHLLVKMITVNAELQQCKLALAVIDGKHKTPLCTHTSSESQDTHSFCSEVAAELNKHDVNPLQIIYSTRAIIVCSARISTI